MKYYKYYKPCESAPHGFRCVLLVVKIHAWILFFLFFPYPFYHFWSNVFDVLNIFCVAVDKAKCATELKLPANKIRKYVGTLWLLLLSDNVRHAGRRGQLKCHVAWGWPPAYQTLAYPAPAAFWSSALPWQTRRRCDWEPVGDRPPWAPQPGSSHTGPCAVYAPKVESSCKISCVTSQR